MVIKNRNLKLPRASGGLNQMRGSNVPKNPLQKRWERRWTAASGVWFAILLAYLFGWVGWGIAVMIAAAAFMLARGGDLLDKSGE